MAILTKQFNFKMSHNDFALLQKTAKRRKTKPSKLMRCFIRQANVANNEACPILDFDKLKETLISVSKANNNLNQIAKALNTAIKMNNTSHTLYTETNSNLKNIKDKQLQILGALSDIYLTEQKRNGEI